jgi:hypothetical protein
VIDGVTNDLILQELFKYMPQDERAVMCSVAGDPLHVKPTAWGGTPWAKGDVCPLKPNRNNYVAISSFGPSPDDNRYRRRKDQFKACHGIMVDDLGTKLDVRSLPQSLIPSLVIETSPGNFQATFFLAEPMTDQAACEDGIRQIIQKLTGGGADPGMAGVTRVLRLLGINGKEKYAVDGVPWSCKVHVWRPDIRTHWSDLARAFGMVHHNRRIVEPDDAVMRDRMRGFQIVKQGLKQLRLVKREGRGWIDITCPWIHEHTGRADTGTAVNPPAQANGWYGGFKCHHGHCEQRNWGDLEDKVGRMIYVNGIKTRGDFQ